MTFPRMVNASCDATTASADCAISSETSGWTVAEAWAYAKDAGWHRTGNTTICPECWNAGQRA